MYHSFRSMLFGAIVACALVAPAMAAEQSREDPAVMATQYAAQATDFRASAAKHAKIAASLNESTVEADVLAAEYKNAAPIK